VVGRPQRAGHPARGSSSDSRSGPTVLVRELIPREEHDPPACALAIPRGVTRSRVARARRDVRTGPEHPQVADLLPTEIATASRPRLTEHRARLAPAGSAVSMQQVAHAHGRRGAACAATLTGRLLSRHARGVREHRPRPKLSAGQVSGHWHGSRSCCGRRRVRTLQRLLREEPIRLTLPACEAQLRGERDHEITRLPRRHAVAPSRHRAARPHIDDPTPLREPCLSPPSARACPALGHKARCARRHRESPSTRECPSSATRWSSVRVGAASGTALLEFPGRSTHDRSR